LSASRRARLDQLAAIFALLLTMLLGMVINTGRQIDSKIAQNAADASTYSGGIVLARGMNSLAYTNHLLCEVMAMTAFLREGRDRHSDPLVPEILAAWDGIGPVLEVSNFQKFEELGRAIPQKTPLEQNMVTAYGDWMAASSEIVLPVVEAILIEEAFPTSRGRWFRRRRIAQTAALTSPIDTGNPRARRPRGPIVESSGGRWLIRSAAAANRCADTLPAVDPAVITTRSRAGSRRHCRTRSPGPALPAAVEQCDDAVVRSASEDVAVRPAVAGLHLCARTSDSGKLRAELSARDS
jgi:hypothetical protein